MKGRGRRGWGWEGERVLLSLLVSFNHINVLSPDQWRIVQTNDPAHTMLDLHPPTSKSCPLKVAQYPGFFEVDKPGNPCW